MPVAARRPLRRMRGGAQAYLLEAEDGHHYVVKFRENPQHLRILVNEWAASLLLDHLDIAHPVTRIVELSSAFLDAHPDVFIQLGSSRKPISPGWHFGSRFPCNPILQSVYDILPDPLMPKVINPEHFLGALVFDKWTGNADARQAIFFRARVSEWRAGADNPLQVGFVTQMIDHGYVFNGPHWDFQDSPMFGLYFRPVVYRSVKGIDAFEPWLSRVEDFPEEIFDRILRETPDAWLAGDDRNQLEKLLEKLLRRRKKVRDLVGGCRGGRVNPFENWR
jgi:hypothetical protein